MMRLAARLGTVPGRDAIVVAALAAFLFFVAANLQAGWMYAIDAILVGMLATGWLSAAWSVRGLELERSVTAEVHEGDGVTVMLALRTRRIPRFFLEITDQSAGLTSHRAVVPVVWPGYPVHLRYAPTALRRGVYAGGTLTVQSSGLTGWFRATRAIGVPSPLTVLPRVWPLRHLRLPGQIVSSDSVVSRPARVGLDVYGVRDYRDGDNVRHVHWRSTARRGRLVIREYERDAHDASVLLLDARPAGGTAESSERFEDLIRAAASVADVLARRGYPVRVAGSVNGSAVEAGPGRSAVMRWLAAQRDDAAMPPSRVYEAVCVPGTPVLVFTADPASVASFADRAIPHTVIVARAGDDLRARLEEVL